jgi:hypothetical protein
MRARSAFLLTGLLVVGGCAPLPVTFYVGDTSVGRLSYNSCSLGAVPEGLVVERGGVEVLADIRPRGDNEVVQLRFDIGHGHQVRLAAREITADPRDGSVPRTGMIEAIDLFDGADPDGWKENADRRAGLRDPGTLMDDSPLPPLATGPRPVLTVRHYWVASALATGHANVLWLQLPALDVDGALVVFPPIRFERHTRVLAAPVNC